MHISYSANSAGSPCVLGTMVELGVQWRAVDSTLKLLAAQCGLQTLFPIAVYKLGSLREGNNKKFRSGKGLVP